MILSLCLIHYIRFIPFRYYTLAYHLLSTLSTTIIIMRWKDIWHNKKSFFLISGYFLTKALVGISLYTLPFTSIHSCDNEYFVKQQPYLLRKHIFSSKKGLWVVYVCMMERTLEGKLMHVFFFIVFKSNECIEESYHT